MIRYIRSGAITHPLSYSYDVIDEDGSKFTIKCANNWDEIHSELIKHYACDSNLVAKNFASLILYRYFIDGSGKFNDVHLYVMNSQNFAIRKMMGNSAQDTIDKRDAIIEKYLLLK